MSDDGFPVISNATPTVAQIKAALEGKPPFYVRIGGRIIPLLDYLAWDDLPVPFNTDVEEAQRLAKRIDGLTPGRLSLDEGCFDWQVTRREILRRLDATETSYQQVVKVG